MLTDNLKGKVKEIWDVLEKEALVSKMRSIVENNAVHRDIDVLRHTQRRLTYFLRNCTWDYSEDPLSTYLDKNSMVNLQKRINSNLNLISRPGKGWLRSQQFRNSQTDEQEEIAPNHEAASCLYTTIC